jgi:hypothetical protein
VYLLNPISMGAAGFWLSSILPASKSPVFFPVGGVNCGVVGPGIK